MAKVINEKNIFLDGDGASEDAFVIVKGKGLYNYLVNAGELYSVRMGDKRTISEAYQLTLTQNGAIERMKEVPKSGLGAIVNSILDFDKSKNKLNFSTKEYPTTFSKGKSSKFYWLKEPVISLFQLPAYRHFEEIRD